MSTEIFKPFWRQTTELTCVVLCCPLAVPVYGAGVSADLTAIVDHKKMC